MKISTKTGDLGTTSLYDGTRVAKDDPRIVCLGELDELLALVGFCKVTRHEEMPFSGIQHLLMSLMTYVSAVGCRPTAELEEQWEGLRSSLVFAEEWMSKRIADAGHDRTFSFLLPGSSLPDVALHMARTKARSCERLLVALPREVKARLLPGHEHLSGDALPAEILSYMNRLSDLFYALALEMT